MAKSVLDSKKALPNKLLQEDGSIVDMAGNKITHMVSLYKNKVAIPNKFLNSDGTYSTLNEIISGAIDTELFIVVEELPKTGKADKIYLLIDGDELLEYIWINNKWDPVGSLPIDMSKYSTTEEMNQAISVALGSLQNAAMYTWDGLSSSDNPTNITLFQHILDDHNAGKSVVIVRSKLNEDKASGDYHSELYVFDKNITNPVTTSTHVSYFVDSSSYVNINLSTSESIIDCIYTRLAIRLNRSDVTEVVGVDVFTYDGENRYLATNKNYSTPYTPQYPGSPATKKYVDDSIANSITSALTQSY